MIKNKKAFSFNIILLICSILVLFGFLIIYTSSNSEEKNSILNSRNQELSNFKNYQIYLDELIKSSFIIYKQEEVNFFLNFEFNEEKIFSCLKYLKIKDETNFLNMLNTKKKNYGCFLEVDTFAKEDFKEKYEKEFKNHIEEVYKNSLNSFFKDSISYSYVLDVENMNATFLDDLLNISFTLNSFDFVRKKKEYLLNFENHNSFYISLHKFLFDFFSNPNCFIGNNKEKCLEEEFKKSFGEKDYKFIVENKKLEKGRTEVIYIKVIKNLSPEKGKKILEFGLFKD